MRALALAILLVACTKPPATAVPPGDKGDAATPTPKSSCEGGQTALFLRDDATHCVWTCDPEADEPCPHDFACVGVGRTTTESLARYCETLKGPGVSDGVSYPSDWKPR
ncbi:MAG: hypothetical protein ACXVEF_40500 [Polyangiales bacterium]